MSMDIAVSPLYPIGGIIQLILYIGAVPAIIYALYLVRKVANK